MIGIPGSSLSSSFYRLPLTSTSLTSKSFVLLIPLFSNSRCNSLGTPLEPVLLGLPLLTGASGYNWVFQAALYETCVP